LKNIFEKVKSTRFERSLAFNFRSHDKIQERLAFRLEGVVPHLIDGIEYAFFQGRFKPFEDQDDDELIDISIFLDALRQVNEGIFTLRNEDIWELESVG
jgi:hypothetical protein